MSDRRNSVSGSSRDSSHGEHSSAQLQSKVSGEALRSTLSSAEKGHSGSSISPVIPRSKSPRGSHRTSTNSIRTRPPKVAIFLGRRAIVRQHSRQISSDAGSAGIRMCRSSLSRTGNLNTLPATQRMEKRAQRRWRSLSESTRVLLAWAGVPMNLGTSRCRP
jgi:hypothetical protein